MGLNDNLDSLKNDEGFKLLRSGSKTKALELLREAALNGHPNALATIIWHYILSDNIEKAVKDYELCIVMTQPWIAKEKSRVDKLWLVSATDKRNLMGHYLY